MSRIVITGLGAITPLGNDVDTFWEKMKAGESAADTIQTFDTTDYVIRIACEVKDFDPTEWLDKKSAKRMARSTQFAVATAKKALADANRFGLDLDQFGQRVLQATRNRDRAAQRHVEVRELGGRQL